jgi:hypothetical protein
LSWNSEKEHPLNPPSQFFKKYGNKNNVLGQLDYISIDRVNLSIFSDTYMPAPDGFERNGYMMTFHFNASCTIVKPKI